MELLRYFFVLCLFLYAEAKSIHYDYEFDEDAKVWLKLHRVKATWHEARKMCNMEGAILASPLNKPIKDALEAYSRAYDIDHIFVGIHATFTGGLWHTIEGISLEKLMDNLDIKQINSDDDRCSVLSAGSLISVKCSGMFPYMCYKRQNSDVQLTSCGTTDKEYILDERTGNCYKFHAQTRTWWDAFKTCSAEEGYLAIINSDTEAQVIKDIFEKYPDTVIKSEHPNVISLGIIDWEQNREWYTIHGERLEDSGYSYWSKGEPNNAGRVEFCGTMFRNGLLNDEPCSKKTAFICEKDVRNIDNSKDVTGLKTTEKSTEIKMVTTEESIKTRMSSTEETKEIPIWTTDETKEIANWTTDETKEIPIWTTDETKEIAIWTTEETKEIPTWTTEETKEIPTWTTEKTAEVTISTSGNTSGVESSSTTEDMPEFMPTDIASAYDIYDEYRIR